MSNCCRFLLATAVASFNAVLLVAALVSSRGAGPLGAAASGLYSSPGARPQQPWCAVPNSPVATWSSTTDQAGSARFPVTPFPASFWFVKTIKTGSSTLTSVFHNICSNYGVQWLATDHARLAVRVRRSNPSQMQVAVDELANVSDNNYMAITNHMWYNPEVADVYKPKYLFTTTRHPLGRVHSHYVQNACVAAATQLGWDNNANHRLPQEYGPNTCDLDPQFLQLALQNDTVESRWTFANTFEGKNQVYNYIRGNKNTVEGAAAQYDFLFTAERMNEGLVTFMLKFGLTFEDIAYLPLKVRKGLYKTAADMPPELNDFIMSNNQLDLQLWDIANKRLDQEKAAIHKQCGTGLVDQTLAAYEQLLDEVHEECHKYVEWYSTYGFGPPFTYTGLAETAFDSGNGFRCVKHVARRYMVLGPAANSETIRKLKEQGASLPDFSACKHVPLVTHQTPWLLWLATFQFLLLLAYVVGTDSGAWMRQQVAARLVQNRSDC